MTLPLKSIGAGLAATAAVVPTTVIEVTDGDAAVQSPESEEAVTWCLTLALDNPHFSAGANGVIAKGRYQCTNVDIISTEMRLFVCDSQPQKDEGWVQTNCKEGGYEHYSWDPANVEYTKYVPAAGTPGARGEGWWIACHLIFVTRENPFEQQASGFRFSNAVYISAP